MTNNLFDQLVGSWELVSYIEKPIDGSAPSYPMGINPMGLIIYTPDGFMSAQIMNPNRNNFHSGDWFDATSEEYKNEATTYIAYSGHFHVDEEARSLTHSMYVSLFPNWTGNTQGRNVAIHDGVLELSNAEPVKSHGILVKHLLTWKKVKSSGK